MPGKHQVKNVLTALTALEILRKQGKIRVERSRLYDGIFKTSHKGRFERMGGKIVLDGAHNEAGARALADTLKDLYPEKKILALIGILKDKEYKKIISIFSEVVTKFIFTEIDNPRKCSVKELARALSKDLESESEHCAEFSDNVEALEFALNELENYDLLLIAGSLYLIGDLRPIIINKLTASD